MVDFEHEMVVRFQDMRSPISYFSKVYGFSGFLNFYRRGSNTEALVTYLREGKSMDELRKAMRARGFEFQDRKAGITIAIREQCYVCEMIDSILGVKTAMIDVPIFVKDGDIILRIKYFKTSTDLQRIVFRDSDKRDFFSIDYLGPVRQDKDWLLENARSWEMKKLEFYVLPAKSFTVDYARTHKDFVANVSIRSVDKNGFLSVFYEVKADFEGWEKRLATVANEYELVSETDSGTKTYNAMVPEQGILIDPYKLSDIDLPFNYNVEISAEKSKVTMIFESDTLDSFFRSIGRLSDKQFLESKLEIKSVERYP